MDTLTIKDASNRVLHRVRVDTGRLFTGLSIEGKSYPKNWLVSDLEAELGPKGYTLITEAYVRPAPTEEDIVRAIKYEAGDRIVSMIPEYKQRNLMALGLITAVEQGLDTTLWDADLKVLWDEFRGLFMGTIAAIRAASDRIEAQVPAMTDDERRAFDVVAAFDEALA